MPPPGYQREVLGGIVHSDGNGILLPEFQEGRDVHAEGAVTVFPFAGQVSVHINFGAGHNAVKVQIELVALGVRQPMPTQGSFPVLFSISIRKGPSTPQSCGRFKERQFLSLKEGLEGLSDLLVPAAA